MTYLQTIDYLFTRLPMFSRIGAAAYKADLTNTIALCNALGNPQHSFKSVHIAGTNGKGSTSHMLAAILQSAGYKTGLYTSPHLKDFRERIKIGGALVDEAFIIDFVAQIQPMIDQLEPSFFEITVAMAFEYFKRQQVDIAVIEVGLGGRLDSTNIIEPLLSIITSIGYDHMNLLGNTLEEITGEKAGIIKAQIPVVIGEDHPITRPIFEAKAANENTRIIFATDVKMIADWQYNTTHLAIEVSHSELAADHKKYRLDLAGIYQLKNVLPVLVAVEELHKLGWAISEQQIEHGLANVKKLTGLHGRWEVISQHPTVITDVAHNEDGIKQLAQQLELTKHHHLHLIIGFVKDKEVEKLLRHLPTTATYYFTKAQISRALAEDELKQMAANFKLQGDSYADVNIALKHARAIAAENDLIVVCGSVFVVGEIVL